VLEDCLVEFLPAKNMERLLDNCANDVCVAANFWCGQTETTDEWNAMAAASASAPCNVRRAVVEFCCGERSKSAATSAPNRDAALERLTIEHDVTASEGLLNATILANEADENVLLWGSLPRAGGAPWGNFSKRRPGGQKRISERIGIMLILLNKIVAGIVESKSGRVAFGWPTHCEQYWEAPEIFARLKEVQLLVATLDGCRFGLLSRTREAIKKPWEVATALPKLSEHLNGQTCVFV
jgi:hypothetical protein